MTLQMAGNARTPPSSRQIAAAAASLRAYQSSYPYLRSAACKVLDATTRICRICTVFWLTQRYYCTLLLLRYADACC